MYCANRFELKWRPIKPAVTTDLQDTASDCGLTTCTNSTPPERTPGGGFSFNRRSGRRAWRRQFYPDVADWSGYNKGRLPFPAGAS